VVLNNAGTFDVRGNQAWYDYAGSTGSLTLNNSGTLKKSAGTGEFEFEDTTLINSGTVEAQVGTLTFGGDNATHSGSWAVASGATLRFIAGTQTMAAGSSMSGAGQIQVSGGTVDLQAGSYAVDFLVDQYNGAIQGTLAVNLDMSMARLTLANGGTLTGTGTVTITGTGSEWTGGTMTGGGTTAIAAGAELKVSGNNRKYLGNRTITNNGTLIEASTGDLVDFDGTVVLNNAGTFDVRGNQAWYDYAGSTGSLTLNNSGTLKKSAGTGDFRFFDTTFNNSGTVTVLTGRILVNGVPL
jgi:hypothetical protein